MTVMKRKEIPADGCEDGPALLQENGNPLVGLTAPTKKVKAGRPSTSREKAPYEESGRKNKILQHLQETWAQENDMS